MANDINYEPSHASAKMFSELYDRLRMFAKMRLNKTSSLYGTELVHEAYLRVAKQQHWDNAAHFLGAVRNAMKNVIVDHFRKKGRIKHGGNFKRVELNGDIEAEKILPQLVALNDALDEFEKHDERAAQIVTLRFFGCMTEEETCNELGISRRTVARDWAYAKAWLSREMNDLLD